MKDRIALLDMDGTIADYDSAMNDALATLRSPGEPVFERGCSLTGLRPAER